MHGGRETLNSMEFGFLYGGIGGDKLGTRGGKDGDEISWLIGA